MKVYKKYKMSLKAVDCKLKIHAGFTLVELLLYISLTAIMLLAISEFLSITLGSRVKNQAMNEVEQQAMHVMNSITQTVRNADGILSPAQDVGASLLSLDVPDESKNPTLFDLSGGAIRITEGVSLPINLTSSRVIVQDLNFQNLSRANTPGIIRIFFTIAHSNPEGRNEYEYTKTFYGSSSLR